MAIYITGDTHGDFSRFSSKKFSIGEKLTKNDVIIITGDFGGIWNINKSSKKEMYWLKWLEEKPWTTLFIDGNHENFDRLDMLNEIDMFGGKVGFLNKSIFHLKRGNVYTIQGKKFFVFGGGYSIDKIYRTPNISWWPQEMPNHSEYKKGLDTLVKYNNKIDFIITHTCSINAFNLMKQSHSMFYKEIEQERQIRIYFSEIEKLVEYDEWFCGHFHITGTYEKTTFLYELIKKIT